MGVTLRTRSDMAVLLPVLVILHSDVYLFLRVLLSGLLQEQRHVSMAFGVSKHDAAPGEARPLEHQVGTVIYRQHVFTFSFNCWWERSILYVHGVWDRPFLLDLFLERDEAHIPIFKAPSLTFGRTNDFSRNPDKELFIWGLSGTTTRGYVFVCSLEKSCGWLEVELGARSNGKLLYVVFPRRHDPLSPLYFGGNRPCIANFFFRIFYFTCVRSAFNYSLALFWQTKCACTFLCAKMMIPNVGNCIRVFAVVR